MTLVPRDAHPGSPAAVDLDCTCRSPANFGGMGHEEEFRQPVPATGIIRTLHKRFWLVDRGCSVHGDEKGKK
jgi:hypothetical protein